MKNIISSDGNALPSLTFTEACDIEGHVFARQFWFFKKQSCFVTLFYCSWQSVLYNTCDARLAIVWVLRE